MMHYDDSPVRDWRLGPGMELTINGVTLIAESERPRALHHVLARVIGFSAEHRPAVDRALRAVLVAARGADPLCSLAPGISALSLVGFITTRSPINRLCSATVFGGPAAAASGEHL
jgi:hypothetical protein